MRFQRLAPWVALSAMLACACSLEGYSDAWRAPGATDASSAVAGSSSGAGAAGGGSQGSSGAAGGGSQGSSGAAGGGTDGTSANAAGGGSQGSSGAAGGGSQGSSGAAGGGTDSSSGAGGAGGTGESALLWEAEDGELFGAFAIASDPGASGGKYVAVPAGAGCHGDEVRFPFDLTAAGVYRIKTRVAEGPTNGVNNSFWVRVDDAPADGYQYDVRGAAWHNDYAKDSKDDDRALTFELDAGPHVVSFACREEQTRLDWIELERQP